MVGDERSAFADERLEEGQGLAITSQVEWIDAVQTIASLAESRQVVMINEAHNASRHRHFAGRVLRALRPLGFTHFAAETFLNAGDEVPSIRNFDGAAPLDFNVGHYTRDPVYAEAVREAAQMGYQFIPYEQSQQQTIESEGGAIQAREDAQARNLAAAITASPEARVVVLAGYGHIHETPDFVFAARFRALTGIDPLTVSQTALGSWGPHGLDGPLTSKLVRRRQILSPVAFRDGTRTIGTDRIDMVVLHPSVEDVGDRPGWLASDPMRQRTQIALPPAADGAHRLVQILHENEPEIAVPADQYLHRMPGAPATFYVRPGSYRMRMETEAGYIDLGAVTI